MRGFFNLVSSHMVSMLWHAHANHLNYCKSCIPIYQHKLWYNYGLLALILKAISIRSNLGRCMKLQTIIKFKFTMVFNLGSSFFFLVLGHHHMGSFNSNLILIENLLMRGLRWEEKYIKEKKEKWVNSSHLPKLNNYML